MILKKPLPLLLILILNPCLTLLSQKISTGAESENPVLDSLKRSGVLFGNFQKKPEIVLSYSQAVRYLQQRYQGQYWLNLSDPFRQALGQLILNATNPPYDSTAAMLKRFPYDSLNIPWDKFYIWEPMRVKIPVNVLEQVPAASGAAGRQDTSVAAVPDSLNHEAAKEPVPEFAYKTVTIQKDTSIMVVIDTLHEVTSRYHGFPFHYFSYPYQSDSIKVAVDALS